MHVLSCIEHSVDGALSLPTACDEVRKSYYSSGISEYRPLAHDVIFSRIRTSTDKYGRVLQHAGYFAFEERAASMAVSANAVMHRQCL